MNKQDWTYKKLGDICKVLNGLWVGKKEPFVNIAVIRNTNFSKDCKLKLDDVAYIDVEEKQFATRKLQPGDIIIEKSGGSDKQPVGRPVLFNIPDGDYSFSNFTSTLRLTDKSIFPPFLHYCLYGYYRNGETTKMQSKTTGLRNLDMKAYLRLSIPYLEIEEQERIVAELDLLSGIIEKKKEQIKAYDQLAQSIFYTMFGDPIDNPKGWEYNELIQLYRFIDYRGKTPNKKAEGIPLITAKNIRKGTIDHSVAEYISESEHKNRLTRGIPQKGDLLFTTEAPLGNAAIADLDIYATAQRLIVLQKRENALLNNNYVLYYILSDIFQEELLKQATGSTIKGIKGSKLEKIRIPVPPLSLQQEFAEKVEAIERQKALVQQSIVETQTMFDYTMDKYFG